MIVKLSEYPILKAAIKQAAPSYKKHSAILFEADGLDIDGGYWDGGSRYGFLQCDLTGHGVESIATSTAPPQFGGSGSKRHDIPGHKMVLKLGTFRGKTATVIITANSFKEFGIDRV